MKKIDALQFAALSGLAMSIIGGFLIGRGEYAVGSMGLLGAVFPVLHILGSQRS